MLSAAELAAAMVAANDNLANLVQQQAQAEEQEEQEEQEAKDATIGSLSLGYQVWADLRLTRLANTLLHQSDRKRVCCPLPR